MTDKQQGKVYVADAKNKVLIEKATISRPQKHPADYDIGGPLYQPCFIEWENYHNHISTLKQYPATWLTEDMDGREFIEGVDFKVGKAYIPTTISTKNRIGDEYDYYSIQIEPQQQGKPQDPFIEKHLAIIKQKTKDALIDHHIGKMWGSLSSASIKYFLETGKVNGGFREHLLNLMDAWKKYKLDETPTEEQKEEWISVKDRLPSDNEKVLVCKYNRQVKEASFLKKDQWDRLNQFIIGGAYYDIVKWITHWMPMPAPPNTASSAPPISQDEKLK